MVEAQPLLQSRCQVAKLLVEVAMKTRDDSHPRLPKMKSDGGTASAAAAQFRRGLRDGEPHLIFSDVMFAALPVRCGGVTAYQFASVRYLVAPLCVWSASFA